MPHNFMQQPIAEVLVKEHSRLNTWSLWSTLWTESIIHACSCTLPFTMLSTMRTHSLPKVDSFVSKLQKFLPHMWKFLPTIKLFRNYSNSIVDLDLIQTHSVNIHQILSITYTDSAFLCLWYKKAWDGENWNVRKLCLWNLCQQDRTD